MSEFWKKYWAIFADYPETVKAAGNALFDIFLHVLALSLPLTFPVLYPLYQLGSKLKEKLLR